MKASAGLTRFSGMGSNARWLSLFRLVRLPNLLIVVLIQLLLPLCVFGPLLSTEGPDTNIPIFDLSLLILGTVLMAMGGYVINDYFDVRIDRINKPDKLVVNRFISARGAIKLHILLNIVAIAIGFILAYKIRSFSFGLIFPFISGLLWLYSVRFKCRVLWGNVIVSILSAMVILIVWLYLFSWLKLNPDLFLKVQPKLAFAGSVVLAYALFAFIVSLFREVIKDLEDLEGDASNGCQTLACIAGIPGTLRFVAVLVLVNITLLAFCQFLSWRLQLYPLFWYVSFILQVLSVILFVKIFTARVRSDFHLLSNLSKILMLAGILSMIFLYLSF